MSIRISWKDGRVQYTGIVHAFRSLGLGHILSLHGRLLSQVYIRNWSSFKFRLFRSVRWCLMIPVIFFPCHSEEECNFLYELVTSTPSREFWTSLIFWDAKRPITAQLLNSLDLMALARILNKACDIARTLAERQMVEYMEGSYQNLLFREEPDDYGSESVSNPGSWKV